MPKEWTWERFTVVDAGSNGDVALHNFYHNGFARSSAALASCPQDLRLYCTGS